MYLPDSNTEDIFHQSSGSRQPAHHAARQPAVAWEEPAHTSRRFVDDARPSHHPGHHRQRTQEGHITSEQGHAPRQHRQRAHEGHATHEQAHATRQHQQRAHDGHATHEQAHATRQHRQQAHQGHTTSEQGHAPPQHRQQAHEGHTTSEQGHAPRQHQQLAHETHSTNEKAHASRQHQQQTHETHATDKQSRAAEQHKQQQQPTQQAHATKRHTQPAHTTNQPKEQAPEEQTPQHAYPTRQTVVFTQAAIVDTEADVVAQQPTASTTQPAAVRSQPQSAVVSRQPAVVTTQPKREEGMSLPKSLANADYIETFSIGGSARTVKAGCICMAEFCALAGSTFAFPALNTVAKCLLQALDALPGQCCETRHSYKIAGAADSQHPPLQDFYRPWLKCEKPPDMFPFPQHVNGRRGTPEFAPFSDFPSAIVGNERGPWYEPPFLGNDRTFKIRFKTGEGGATLFHVRRDGVAYECLASVCNPALRAEPWNVDIYDDDGITKLGSIRPSTQWLRGERLFGQGAAQGGKCLTCFPYRSEPIYDIVDSQGRILFTVLRPKIMKGWCRKKPKFLDFFAIVRGIRQLDSGVESGALEDDAGWVVDLQPKWARFISMMISSMTFLGPIVYPLQPLESVCKLLEQCPIDNVSQVPNPGLSGIRNPTRFSHTLNAFRTKLPLDTDEVEKKLIMALPIMMEFEFTYLDITGSGSVC